MWGGSSMVSNCFLEYLESQIDVIRTETQMDTIDDPETRDRLVMEWIELRAAEFRANWNSQHRQVTV